MEKKDASTQTTEIDYKLFVLDSTNTVINTSYKFGTIFINKLTETLPIIKSSGSLLYDATKDLVKYGYNWVNSFNTKTKIIRITSSDLLEYYNPSAPPIHLLNYKPFNIEYNRPEIKNYNNIYPYNPNFNQNFNNYTQIEY